MKLILLESVDGLGRPGDQVAVRAGYARNFLLPYRKAVQDTPDSQRMLGRLKKKAEEEERAMIASMEELAGKLSGFEVSLQARATEERHLFGSVNEKDIHAALEAAGWHQVPLRAVRLPAHIKEAGRHEVSLHLYGKIQAAIVVDVVPVDAEGAVIEESVPEESAAPAEGEAGASAEGEAAATAEA